MNGKYLFDTNIVIEIINNEILTMSKIEEEYDILISSFVIGELYYGAYCSSRKEDNLFRVKSFISKNTIVHCNNDTAEIYGKVKSELRLKGRPIPENDIWIASIAIQNNLILVSKDKHFNEIDDLKLEVW